MPAMIDRLVARGAEVDLVYPDELAEGAELRADTDLCVLKAKTERALRLASAVHERGVRTLNPFPVTSLCRDKIATSKALELAGVPVPPTYVEQDARKFAPLLADGPLIVKPYRGSQGEGIEVVETVDQLPGVHVGPGPVMAQRYFEPDGPDSKIYRIGAEFFCVARKWPPRTYAEKLGTLVPLTDELLEVARRCGEALGIELYGVDVIVHRGEPLVVDMSSFPGFKGVPRAGQRLGDYVYRQAHSSTSPSPEARQR